MKTSEFMTIIIIFHKSIHRDCDTLYIGLVQRYRLEDFLSVLSYTRFLHKMYALIIPTYTYLLNGKRKPTGTALVDSLCLKIFHNIRITRNQVFEGAAIREKGTNG
jgi:hypothetical protein